MRLTGYIFDFDSLNEYDKEINEAGITDSKISLDWSEDGDTYSAVLHSVDGTYYKGTFGTPIPEPLCVMAATRYKSKCGEVLLWLTWYRKDTGYEGGSIVRLADSWE